MTSHGHHDGLMSKIKHCFKPESAVVDKTPAEADENGLVTPVVNGEPVATKEHIKGSPDTVFDKVEKVIDLKTHELASGGNGEAWVAGSTEPVSTKAPHGETFKIVDKVIPEETVAKILAKTTPSSAATGTQAADGTVDSTGQRTYIGAAMELADKAKQTVVAGVQRVTNKPNSTTEGSDTTLTSTDKDMTASPAATGAGDTTTNNANGQRTYVGAALEYAGAAKNAVIGGIQRVTGSGANTDTAAHEPTITGDAVPLPSANTTSTRTTGSITPGLTTSNAVPDSGYVLRDGKYVLADTAFDGHPASGALPGSSNPPLTVPTTYGVETTPGALVSEQHHETTPPGDTAKPGIVQQVKDNAFWALQKAKEVTLGTNKVGTNSGDISDKPLEEAFPPGNDSTATTNNTNSTGGPGIVQKVQEGASALAAKVPGVNSSNASSHTADSTPGHLHGAPQPVTGSTLEAAFPPASNNATSNQSTGDNGIIQKVQEGASKLAAKVPGLAAGNTASHGDTSPGAANNVTGSTLEQAFPPTQSTAASPPKPF